MDRSLSTNTNQFKNTDSLGGGSSTTYDAGLRALSTEMQKNPIGKTEKTIMERFSDRRRLGAEASQANAGIIESRYSEMIEDTEGQNDREVTNSQEQRRGFGTNMGALREFVKAGDKRIRDLVRVRDELLLQNKSNEASRLDALLVDEETALTGARQSYISNLLNLGREQREVAGFQTPEQKFTDKLREKAPDAGILPNDSSDVATEKYRNSASYKMDMRKGEVDIQQSLAAAEASRASTAKSLAETRGLSGDSSEVVSDLKEKVGLIDSLLSSKGLAGSVGTYGISRWTPFSVDKGARQEFAAGVNQIVSKEVIDTLINLKERGGTLGALSDQERILLQSAATKIGTWMQRDKSGMPTGKFEVSEETFKNELKTIKRLADKAIIKAGGTPSALAADDVDEVGSYFGTRGLGGNTTSTQAFNPANFFNN